MHLRQYLSALIVACALPLWGADKVIPASYYAPIDGKAESALKTAVHNVIYPHTEISSYQALPSYFQRTDVYPQSSRWWDMYSDIPLYAPSFRGLNREHSFPKSWWGGATDVPAYIDLNHLYPSEAAANMAKSNYPLGEVDPTKPATFDNGITTVGIPVTGQGGNAKLVFEPDDEYKGDFARTYFYMATCYQDMRWKYTYMVDNNVYPTLNGWSRELLLKWNELDPVSQKEIDRNETVYAIQNNRNPFIDFPELAEYIWGNRKGEPFILKDHISGEISSGKPDLINPTQGSYLEFGEVAEGHTAKAKLQIHGENLTAGTKLRLRIYNDSESNGADQFNIDGSNIATVTAEAANSASGVWVTIEYAPKQIGQHNTRLVISGAGYQGSLGIGLRGECLPVPVLTAPTATAATDVTSTTYTANWIPVEGETVDYWVVNRTRYDGGSASTEQLVAEDPMLKIDDFCGAESYTVQSVRLGIYSPESNAIAVGNAGITTVNADNAMMGFIATEGGVIATCPYALTSVYVLTPSGRVYTRIDRVENNDLIELPDGVYIITAREVATPVKVMVRSE